MIVRVQNRAHTVDVLIIFEFTLLEIVMSFYKTIEFPLISDFPSDQVQVEAAEKLLLLFLATHDSSHGNISTTRKIGFLEPCEVTEDVKTRIFKHLKIDPKNKDDYKSIITVIIKAGGLDVCNHIFDTGTEPKPGNRKKPDVPTNKEVLLGYIKRGLLPIKLSKEISRVSAAQVVESFSWEMDSYVKISARMIEERDEGIKKLFEEHGEKEVLKIAEDKTIKKLYDWATVQNNYRRYLNIKINGKKEGLIEPEVLKKFNEFDVDWKEVDIYGQYHKLVDRNIVKQFSSYPEYCGRTYFDSTTGNNCNYHPIKNISISKGKIYFDVILNKRVKGNIVKEHCTIMGAMSGKVIDLKINEDLSCTYYNNTRLGRTEQISGSIQTLKRLDDKFIQLIIKNNDLKPAHNFDIKEVEALRTVLSTAMPSNDYHPNSKDLERSSKVKEGMRIMAVDIGSMPLIAWSVKEITFNPRTSNVEKTPDGKAISSSLTNGDKIYLINVDEGRIGEATENYRKMQNLINRTRTIRKIDILEDGRIDVKKKRRLQKMIHKIGIHLRRGRNKKDEGKNAVEKTFCQDLTADYYKYLDLIDNYISTVISVETKGFNPDEAKEIRNRVCSALKIKRQNVRKDLSNKIINEVVKKCIEYNVAMVVVEDFDWNYFSKDERPWKNRMKKLMRMKGFETMIQSKLSERKVLLMNVNPEYTSRTFKDEYWGLRDRESGLLYPYVDGEFISPVDDQVNAANNILIRAFNRHSNVHSVNVKHDKDKIVPQVQKRKQGALYQKYGQTKFIPKEFINEDDLEKMRTTKSSQVHKLYLGVDNIWSLSKPDEKDGFLENKFSEKPSKKSNRQRVAVLV